MASLLCLVTVVTPVAVPCPLSSLAISAALFSICTCPFLGVLFSVQIPGRIWDKITRKGIHNPAGDTLPTGDMDSDAHLVLALCLPAFEDFSAGSSDAGPIRLAASTPSKTPGLQDPAPSGGCVHTSLTAHSPALPERG